MNLLRHFARLPFALGLWQKFPVGSVARRVEYGIFPYAHYAYGVYWAAISAARLGIPRISVMEFGVAGGRGLLALEKASGEIERAVGVGIDVVGFDSGSGMPPPLDYRDLPHIWGPGFYAMEPDKLRARLARAQLVLGNVADTVRDWLAGGERAPVGFVSFDLDYYSSTKAAFALFEGAAAAHLPRVYCYFDDVCSNALGCMSEFQGELLAIREFNEAHADRKIAKIPLVRIHRPRWEPWQEQMYALHDFAHPQYNAMLIPPTLKERQLPL
jgi:hypothetical protein